MKVELFLHLSLISCHISFSSDSTSLIFLLGWGLAYDNDLRVDVWHFLTWQRKYTTILPKQGNYILLFILWQICRNESTLLWTYLYLNELIDYSADFPYILLIVGRICSSYIIACASLIFHTMEDNMQFFVWANFSGGLACAWIICP